MNGEKVFFCNYSIGTDTQIHGKKFPLCAGCTENGSF